jgi:tRNA (guanine37-N1)-methyltransferase
MTLFHAHIITLFPEMFPGPLGSALSGKAHTKGIWSYTCVNPRDFAGDVHKTVDDTPFGGGAGMVLKPDILNRAVRAVDAPGRLIYLSARGRRLTQSLVADIAAMPRVTLLCGRYEGVDQRVLDAHGFDEICVGDYVLSGGEVAAMVMLDACIRLLPGVMGNVDTAGDESFSVPGRLEYPHYTRPAVWVDAAGVEHRVPDILTSGDHARIKAWRETAATAWTKKMRPDLIAEK